ncbi:YndJ family protein [Pontibacillus sp. ALD_SL1]|uniref:YndJ family protein n=1 Tax=Pontibacillus sp. ALD_SL1 TaxID=2777185 RepID=UPI001A959438|nr:YndJ family protein [Pontibacillus sp. ALD_SL1]QSS99519.1 YndJ family protein [Pontibacillus sp. ALD_SL1]
MIEKKRSLFGFTIFIIFIVLQMAFTSIHTEQYVQLLLVFAYGTLIPLMLALAKTEQTNLYRALLNIHPFSFVLACISFLLERGSLSFILSLPWFGFTAFITIYGLVSFFKTKAWKSMQELLIHAGMIYIVIGGAWLSLHRLNIDVLHFQDILILLTSIHFHYAAFITIISFGLMGRLIRSRQRLVRRVYNGLGAFLLLGPIFVALGITFSPVSPLIEFLSVVEFVVPIALFALLSLGFIVPNVKKPKARVSFIIAFFSLFVSMSFAFLYGYGHISEISVLDIPLMVFVHGFVNSFGFSLFMILGLWHEKMT